MIGGREARDRTTLALAPAADRLVRAVTAACPRTVLVIMSSYPYVTPDAPAIIWTSHAGQETGHALADLILGRHAPEGRLAQTWYAADADLPDPLDYDIIKAGWTYQYLTTRPRFPFGHGLTYTTFGYGRLVVEAADPDQLRATLDITNTGDRAGTEVVQLYASYAGPGQPRRRLCGFTRVTLAPGQSATARIGVPLDRLRLWDVAAGRMALPPGPVEIGAGASSADIRQTAPVPVPAAPSGRRPARIAAADFDDYANIALVDTTREAGTAVTPADPARPGWLTFTNLHNERAGVAAFVTACAEPRGGRIEVRLTPHGNGEDPLASVRVPDTGDRYAWTEISATVALPADADQVCLVLHGPVRLDWFRL
jgi:beta-glucosidase